MISLDFTFKTLDLGLCQFINNKTNNPWVLRVRNPSGVSTLPNLTFTYENPERNGQKHKGQLACVTK